VNISDKTFEQRMADVMKHPTAEQAHMVVTQQMLEEIHFMLREMREERKRQREAIEEAKRRGWDKP
jgi:hypothetical protein